MCNEGIYLGVFPLASFKTTGHITGLGKQKCPEKRTPPDPTRAIAPRVATRKLGNWWSSVRPVRVHDSTYRNPDQGRHAAAIAVHFDSRRQHATRLHVSWVGPHESSCRSYVALRSPNRLAARIADYKWPDVWKLGGDPLPRNQNGKIQKNLVKKVAEEAVAAAVVSRNIREL